MERLTTPEVAARLGCSKNHVRQLVHDGKLHVQRPSPRVLLFDASEVDAYAAQTFPRGWQRGRPRKTPPAEGGTDADL